MEDGWDILRMVEIHWGWLRYIEDGWDTLRPELATISYLASNWTTIPPRHKFLFLRCWPMCLFLSICMLQEIIQNAWIFCWGHKRDAKQVARLEFACSYITGLRHPSHFENLRLYRKTLPKAQRTRGLSVLIKVTSLGHITISYTNLDQISSSESLQSINFKISTKHQHLD